MKVLIVNGKRFLINEKSSVVDQTCERIINNFPHDAVVEFDTGFYGVNYSKIGVKMEQV